MEQTNKSINRKAFLDDRTLLFLAFSSSIRLEVLDMNLAVFSGLASTKLGREAKMTKRMKLFFRQTLDYKKLSSFAVY